MVSLIVKSSSLYSLGLKGWSNKRQVTVYQLVFTVAHLEPGMQERKTPTTLVSVSRTVQKEIPVLTCHLENKD